MYKRWKSQKKSKEEDASSQNKGPPHEDTRPYLQQKAELEAEEKRKHELEALERRYELPAGEQDSMNQTRKELRGEEHSAKLGISR